MVKERTNYELLVLGTFRTCHILEIYAPVTTGISNQYFISNQHRKLTVLALIICNMGQ